jgi:copper chaperone NosL
MAGMSGVRAARVAIGLVLALAACRGGEPAVPGAATSAHKSHPATAARGIDAADRTHQGPKDRCPVCGMAPDTEAAIVPALELDDGRTWYFCGTGCLFRAWLHPDVVLNVERTAVRRAIVVDGMTGLPLDASEALFIAGTDGIGRMGPLVVPLANPEEVAAYRLRFGGDEPFRLADLDDARWDALAGRKRMKAPTD